MSHKNSNRRIIRTTNGFWRRGMIFGLLASTVGTLGTIGCIGCSSASNSEVKPDGATATGGGSGGIPGGSGTGGTVTSGATGGSGSGSGGAPAGSGGAGGTGTGIGGASGECSARTAFTLAVHITLDVTWPATSATSAGTGKVHIWNRSKFTANGTALAGETSSCGTVLPEFGLNFAGQLVTGGSKVSVEVPHSVWDAPSIPKFPNSGNISGWTPGSMIKIMPTIALVGLTMPDSMAAWPMSYTGIMPVDADGDGAVGFTAVPKQGNGYVAPPTGLGLFGSAPSADKVYLASRTVVGLNGKLDSCTTQSGTAEVTFFDSHVVGCHVKGAAECTAAQTDFVDQSRTNYKVQSGTFLSKQIADGSSCADVRAALPM